MQKEISENSRLFLAMLNEGNKGDISAYEDALRVIKEIEIDGSRTAPNVTPSLSPW